MDDGAYYGPALVDPPWMMDDIPSWLKTTPVANWTFLPVPPCNNSFICVLETFQCCLRHGNIGNVMSACVSSCDGNTQRIMHWMAVAVAHHAPKWVIPIPHDVDAPTGCSPPMHLFFTPPGSSPCQVLHGCLFAPPPLDASLSLWEPWAFRSHCITKNLPLDTELCTDSPWNQVAMYGALDDLHWPQIHSVAPSCSVPTRNCSRGGFILLQWSTTGGMECSSNWHYPWLAWCIGSWSTPWIWCDILTPFDKWWDGCVWTYTLDFVGEFGWIELPLVEVLWMGV